MFFDISDPIFDVVKGFFICNIINEHNPHSPSVICSGYSSETFLKYLRLVMVCLSGKYFKGLYRLLWAFKALHVITWPAVSQICSLIFLPSSSIVRILKSMPRNYNARIDVHICLVDCNLRSSTKYIEHFIAMVVQLTYRGYECCIKSIFREPKQHTSFPYSRVTN